MTIYAVYSKKWLMPGLTSESGNSVRNLMRDWAFPDNSTFLLLYYVGGSHRIQQRHSVGTAHERPASRLHGLRAARVMAV
jgi:hypothetical protein